MKLLIILLLISFSGVAHAKKNKNTYDYPFLYYKRFEIKGSEKHHKFTFDLRSDRDVIKEIKNNRESGIISYLLFENNKIVVDESDIPTHIQGDKVVNELLLSNSMGKSLVSYVVGHAICEGYIKNTDSKLSDWKTVANTLFENQTLIDLLNMQAGDDKYVGERFKPRQDNILKEHPTVNVNSMPLKDLMIAYFQNTKRNAKKSNYNYSALTTNVIMNYVIHKTGRDWEKLLHKVFNEHIAVKDNVYFSHTVPRHLDRADLNGETGWYQFYANRYDYLRIAKRMLDDWHEDTCAGKYLKLIYNGRIKKNDGVKEPDDVALYTASYGGQFHFDVFGLQKRKIIGLSGFAGQQILIDLDRRRIVVVNSLYKNYDWKTIVYERIKD